MACPDIDRLSQLTDSLLFIIISSLPFKEAARTSILSKRWVHIWHSTKNIDLDESNFKTHNRELNDHNREIQRTVFFDFSRRWIWHYKEPIVEKFRLAVSKAEMSYVSEMGKFVEFAIDRGVRVLDLDFSDPDWKEQRIGDNQLAFFELPKIVYGHEKLESLKLFSCNFELSKMSNVFQGLKSLSLGWIELSLTSLNTLISNCQLLESLNLKRCWNLGYFDIIAPRLRRLVIDRCENTGGEIRIEAPKLGQFGYSGEVILNLEIVHDTLEEVFLDFGLEYEYEAEFGDILCDIFRTICYVRVLNVCSYTLQVITTGEEPQYLHPRLENVQHLILRTALTTNEFFGISFFLNSCPSLGTLSIFIAPANIFPDIETVFNIDEHEFLSNTQYITVYACMRNTLRTVQIKGFKGGVSERAMLRYVIRYSSVLETLSICVSKEGDSRAYTAHARRLMRLQPASPHLRIAIS